MCGIVGYIGKEDAKKVILSGLSRLEYRGYDSAGVSLLNENSLEFEIFRHVGRVQKLIDNTLEVAKSKVGIGHTRWATHGKVCVENAHPHHSNSKRFIVVHNGVIENFMKIKEQYLPNSSFYSETDTEVIAQLIEMFSEHLTVENAISTSLKLLEGSYALLIIDQTNPNTIYAAKNKSPMLIGKGKDGITIASDLIALAGYSDSYLPLDDYTLAVVKENKLDLYTLDHEEITYKTNKVELDPSLVDLGHYEHYMLKEIEEQPDVINRIVENYFSRSLINNQIISDIKNSDRIYMLAAGTSMHAGLIGKHLFEKLANKPVEVHIASEFAYHMPILSNKPFFIMISQSGETADLRACLLKLKARDYKVLTVTNVKTSTLAREANYYLELFAGPEIAVASTKAYIAQIAVLSILAYELSDKSIYLKEELLNISNAIKRFLETEIVQKLVLEKLTKKDCFFIGRSLDYYVSLEAALKLKEISYIHAEGFAAGELKHGTIALIEENTPVVALVSSKELSLNTRSNINEVKARGANVLIISLESTREDGDQIVLSDVHPLLTPIIMVIPTQLIAYYAALARGLDIDKPRNLAKSVTVE